jgi:hypothetical protein
MMQSKTVMEKQLEQLFLLHHPGGYDGSVVTDSNDYA